MRLDIDQSSLIVSCDSCTYAKITCSPLPKKRLESMQTSSAARSTQMCGDHHWLSPYRASYITLVLLMTKPDTLNWPCSHRRAVHSMLTWTSKPGPTPSIMPRSSSSSLIVVASTLVGHSMTTWPNRELNDDSLPTIC